MFARTRKRPGFTAIELMMTLGTLIMASGMTVPMYRQYLVRNDLEVARQNVSQGIERAKYLSQVAMNDSEWGYSTDAVPGRGVVFMGTSYASRNSAFDEMYSIPTNVTVSGVTEVSFQKITGLPSEIGTITLTSLSGEQKTVDVNFGADGTVSIPADWMSVCANPYTNPTTMQVPDSLYTWYITDQGALSGSCPEGGIGGGSSTCGNSTIESGEDCDDGGESATCDSNCTTATCGDSLVNSTAGEVCDAGGESAVCDTDCTTVSCGDGTTNATAGEDCDGSGETALCNSDCTTATCGDGKINTTAGETCDDSGETASCDDDCTGVSCGDGNANAAAGEDCDDAGESATCDSNCTTATCGDNTLNTTAGETCDDGGESATCDDDCTSVSCGDGNVNETSGEQCDDGNTTGGDGCSAACQTEACGNSFVDVGETCDDGGESATCDTDCTAQVCGDGVHNSTAGETCDDAGDSVSCDADCTAVSCGDGTVNTAASETCDDSGESATCDSDCTAAVCGDGTLNTTAGETCDGGGETVSCDTDCTTRSCGDSTVNTTAGETCDDGGESATCDTDCTTASCGDGTLNTTAGEACDDGNTTNNDGCSSTCEDEGVTFTITDDTVTPNNAYDCTLTVLGAALTAGGAYDKAVTARVKFGSTWNESPFGDWDLAYSSNLNDGQTHTFTCPTTYSAGTAFNIEARDWNKRYSWYSGNSNSHWTSDTRVDSSTGDQVKLMVLKDGDAKPNVSGYLNQASVETFVQDYVDFSTGTMDLAPNQVIYLFELGSCTNCSAADYQDVVLLMTFESP